MKLFSISLVVFFCDVFKINLIRKITFLMFVYTKNENQLQSTHKRICIFKKYFLIILST